MFREGAFIYAVQGTASAGRLQEWQLHQPGIHFFSEATRREDLIVADHHFAKMRLAMPAESGSCSGNEKRH
jgi:hypothetical protein